MPRTPKKEYTYAEWKKGTIIAYSLLVVFAVILPVVLAVLVNVLNAATWLRVTVCAICLPIAAFFLMGILRSIPTIKKRGEEAKIHEQKANKRTR